MNRSIRRLGIGMVVLYLALFAISTVLLAGIGVDFVTALGAVAATIGNIGPGLNAVGPTQNFAFWGPLDKLLMVLLMWMGRLEIYAIAALFSRAFWRR